MMLRRMLQTYGTAMAGGALILFFAAFAPHFASPANLLNILKDTSFLAILAIGFTIALVTAELDLSIADVASLAAVVTGALIHAGEATALAVLAGLAVGAVGGAFNGVSVTILKVPSLIATLGTAAIARGAAFMITEGVSFTGRWPTGFTDLARGAVFGVPALVLWLALVAGLAWFMLKQTRLGAHLIATGEAGNAARLTGIATVSMKRLALGIAGLLAGVTAVLLTANLSSAAPNMAADYFLYGIAAVLLGMTMFEPGRANVPGTIVAAFVLKALGNGLVLMGSQYYWQDIILGFTIIGSVAFSAASLKQAAFAL